MSVSGGETRRLDSGRRTQRVEGEWEIHEISIRVPANLRWLRGHFDGHPVLPALVQLHEALLLIEEIWPDLSGVRQISRAKFNRPIRPADTLQLILRRSRGSSRARFEYLRDGEPCSSGMLEFADPPGGGR